MASLKEPRQAGRDTPPTYQVLKDLSNDVLLVNGTVFLRFCTDVLDRTGRAVQEALSGLVTVVRRLSADPIFESEILFTRAKARIWREFGGISSEGHNRGASSELHRLLERGRGYDENIYWRPVGTAVLVVVLIFFFLIWPFNHNLGVVPPSNSGELVWIRG